MTNVQDIPHVRGGDVEDGAARCEQPAEAATGGFDGGVPGARPVGERVGADVAGADGVEVRRELALSGAEFIARPGDLAAGLGRPRGTRRFSVAVDGMVPLPVNDPETDT